MLWEWKRVLKNFFQSSTRSFCCHTDVQGCHTDAFWSHGQLMVPNEFYSVSSGEKNVKFWGWFQWLGEKKSPWFEEHHSVPRLYIIRSLSLARVPKGPQSCRPNIGSTLKNNWYWKGMIHGLKAGKRNPKSFLPLVGRGWEPIVANKGFPLNHRDGLHLLRASTVVSVENCWCLVCGQPGNKRKARQL